MRDDQERLRDMLEACDAIIRRTPDDADELRRDELLRVWMIYHLQTLGEAARALSDATRSSSRDIPWSEIIGMRHILVHRYFGVDIDLIWNIVSRQIPGLRERIEDLISG